jgi:hypothetical protein
MNSDRNPGVLGESLPPILGPVENGKRTLKILDNIDFDLMGYLLSCHLIVEHYIDEFLHAHYPDLDWDAARLTFEKRVALLSKWGLGHDPIPEIKHLNTLRNRLSHHVDSPYRARTSCRLCATCSAFQTARSSGRSRKLCCTSSRCPPATRCLTRFTE